jgi:hypothetical protein
MSLCEALFSMWVAGHVSQQMLDHYSHVRIEAKRKALDALVVGVKTVGYDTNKDTKPVERAILSGKLLKKMAGTTGLEPAASAVTGQRSNQLNYVPTVFHAVGGKPARLLTFLTSIAAPAVICRTTAVLASQNICPCSVTEL